MEKSMKNPSPKKRQMLWLFRSLYGIMSMIFLPIRDDDDDDDDGYCMCSWNNAISYFLWLIVVFPSSTSSSSFSV